MRYPKLRELVEAVKALIVGPYTSGYPATPHQAMPGYRGRPTPNDDYCIGCDACARVCPADAIQITDEGDTRTILRLYDRCNFCGQCEYWCTTKKGVRLTTEYELATTDRRQSQCEQKFELVRCEECGEKIATRKHCEWTYRTLGPLAYGNPTLMNIQQAAQQGGGIPPAPLGDTAQRGNTCRILCPTCRHRATLFEEYGG